MYLLEQEERSMRLFTRQPIIVIDHGRAWYMHDSYKAVSSYG